MGNNSPRQSQRHSHHRGVARRSARSIAQPENQRAGRLNATKNKLGSHAASARHIDLEHV